MIALTCCLIYFQDEQKKTALYTLFCNGINFIIAFKANCNLHTRPIIGGRHNMVFIIGLEVCNINYDLYIDNTNNETWYVTIFFLVHLKGR